jgi:transcriptional regulator with XRE-family HTH domain
MAQHAFADVRYLMHVIAFLSAERTDKKIGLSQLARRSKLNEKMISRAESGNYIPSTREFKAWTRALGFSWEEIWSLCFPMNY